MKKILQIEDNKANQILVERILSQFNYELMHAPDGETGVQLSIDEKPDLILVDMGLPDVDGQTVVTMLKQIPDLSHVPIVAITAWPEDKAVEIAQRYGCDGCIVKPIDVKTFPSQIEQYLA
ncbi:MAG: response regulator [Chloroflexota bacterium]